MGFTFWSPVYDSRGLARPPKAVPGHRDLDSPFCYWLVIKAAHPLRRNIELTASVFKIISEFMFIHLLSKFLL